MFVVNYAAEGSDFLVANPRQENKQVIEREMSFMKNLVEADQKGGGNKREHFCVGFLVLLLC